jgi:hypothetical protein
MIDSKAVEQVVRVDRLTGIALETLAHVRGHGP